MAKSTDPNDSPKKREYRKRTFKNLSRAEKQEKIDAQVDKVQIAESAIHESKWRCADELAALVDLHHNCYGRDITSPQLKRLADIDRNGPRLMTYAKLADFFPPGDLRIKGIGIRVYEDAYKFNQKLKQWNRPQFTSKELVEEMAVGRGAQETRFRLDNKAYYRDREMLIEERKKAHSKLLVHPAYATQNKKRWLKLIEVDPGTAIGAAIATIQNDSRHIESLNTALKKLGSNYRVEVPSERYVSPWTQQDIEDIELD